MVIWFKKLYLIMLDYRAYSFVCHFRSDYLFIFLFIKCINNSRIHEIDYKVELVVNNRAYLSFWWISHGSFFTIADDTRILFTKLMSIFIYVEIWEHITICFPKYHFNWDHLRKNRWSVTLKNLFLQVCRNIFV